MAPPRKPRKITVLDTHVEYEYNGIVFLADKEDLPLLEKFSWRARRAAKTGSPKYYLTAQQTYYVNGKRKLIHFHREVINAPDGLFVDHKSRDTRDNRKSNLRVCTHSQNMVNVCRKSKLGIRGVQKRKNRRWEAKLKLPNTEHTVVIGRYDSAAEAVEAYNARALEVNGEFAILSKLPEGFAE